MPFILYDPLRENGQPGLRARQVFRRHTLRDRVPVRRSLLLEADREESLGERVDLGVERSSLRELVAAGARRGPDRPWRRGIAARRDDREQAPRN